MTRGGAIAVVVLAAGRAARFGSTKQLARVGGRPLVRVTVESVLDEALDEVVVVVGHDATRVLDALEGLPVRSVVNARWAEGMGTSVAAGIGALSRDARGAESRPVGAAIVALADQPLPPRVIVALIDAWRRGPAYIVVPSYTGARGNPVLFDASAFPELVALEGDRGARELIESSPERVARVEFDFAAPVDVDTPEELDFLGG